MFLLNLDSLLLIKLSISFGGSCLMLVRSMLENRKIQLAVPISLKLIDCSVRNGFDRSEQRLEVGTYIRIIF